VEQIVNGLIIAIAADDAMITT